MPLTRATVTIASRIMLPMHAVFSAGIGAAWVLQDPHRTNTAAFHFLNAWPIAGSGTILLALAAAILAGLISHKRAITAIALGAGMVVYLLLAGLILAASIQAHASWSAALWPVYIAVGHLASMLSLANDELTDADGNHRRVRP